MKIARIRKKIDAIDRELVRLLGVRARHSLEIGRMKQAAGMRLFHRKREQEIAHNVARVNGGPLSDRAVQHLWEQILQHTRAAVRNHLRKDQRQVGKAASRRRTPFNQVQGKPKRAARR